MTKRGRPPGVDSAATRARIIDAARNEFAQCGYSATTVSAIARSSNLAPSAIYHYFGGKAELYEAVFEATGSAIWSRFTELVGTKPTLIESVEILLDARVAEVTQSLPHYSDFLAMLPLEARLHPEFAHLLEQRSKFQRETFGRLAEIGLATGELACFDDLDQATDALRCLLMGFFFESYFYREGNVDGVQAVLRLVGALAMPASERGAAVDGDRAAGERTPLV